MFICKKKKRMSQLFHICYPIVPYLAISVEHIAERLPAEDTSECFFFVKKSLLLDKEQ